MPSAAHFHTFCRAAQSRRIQRLITPFFSNMTLFYNPPQEKIFSFNKKPFSPLLRRAQDIFHDVHGNHKLSRYSHSNASVYHSNCYGFVNFLLCDIYPEAFVEIRDEMEVLKDEVPPSVDGSPCPFNYAAAFKRQDLKHWDVLEHLSEVLPGDVLVYMPLNFVPAKTFKMGQRAPDIHMMIVEEILSSYKGNYHFSIIDCTRVPHNRVDDTRYPKRNGIGRSSVFLKEWKKEYLLQWSPRGKSLKREIVGARLKHLL